MERKQSDVEFDKTNLLEAVVVPNNAYGSMTYSIDNSTYKSGSQIDTKTLSAGTHTVNFKFDTVSHNITLKIVDNRGYIKQYDSIKPVRIYVNHNSTIRPASLHKNTN